MLQHRLPLSRGLRSARPASWRRPSARTPWRGLLRVAQPQRSDNPLALTPKRADGPSTDLSVILGRLIKLALPYWQTESSARWKLAGVVGLTLATTGVSVVFNFLGRDFFTALSEKDEVAFKYQLVKYLAGFALGIPVFVFKGYFQSKLALEWRQWMTERLLSEYLAGRTFYGLQQSGEVDNPDQRISSDVATFTDTALGLSLTLLNAGIDLVSFSGILFSIYPPLFAALIVYSLGGTAASVALGKNLVTLNFTQEAREADFRYGLVRVRENAESIAFYGGEQDERELLKQRLQAAVSNYLGLLTASRNLDFFTSFYRYLIQLLPAAVVAPLFFQGKIDFGVINQSQSAFNHILNDVSLVIYQIEALAGFSAVVDRLGEFQEAMTARQEQQAKLASAAEAGDQAAAAAGVDAGVDAGGAAVVAVAALPVPPAAAAAAVGGGSGEALPGIQLRLLAGGEGGDGPMGRRPLLRVHDLTVVTPRGSNVLLRGLDLQVPSGSSLLVMGPSGAGKTSLLRAVAGLWSDGAGRIELGVAGRGEVMFLPQRPYMVLGSLRDQAQQQQQQQQRGRCPRRGRRRRQRLLRRLLRLRRLLHRLLGAAAGRLGGSSRVGAGAAGAPADEIRPTSTSPRRSRLNGQQRKRQQKWQRQRKRLPAVVLRVCSPARGRLLRRGGCGCAGCGGGLVQQFVAGGAAAAGLGAAAAGAAQAGVA